MQGVLLEEVVDEVQKPHLPVYPRATRTLHPDVWLGHQLGRDAGTVSSTGFARLDRELPGQGWPHRAVTEILCSSYGIGDVRLIAVAIAAGQAQGQVAMLVNPPALLQARGLVALGIDLRQLVVLGSAIPLRPDDVCWSLEQALKSKCAGPLVGWLPPRLPIERVRRLQLAAHGHDQVAMLFRDRAQRDRPSPAPLRLAIAPAGVDRLQVDVLKRRGPTMSVPIVLELPQVLSRAARERAGEDHAIPRDAPAKMLAHDDAY